MSICKSPLKMSPSCRLKKSRSPPRLKCSLHQCVQSLESAVHTKFCLLLQEIYFTEISVVSASIQGCAPVTSCTNLSLTMYPLMRCQVTRQVMMVAHLLKCLLSNQAGPLQSPGPIMVALLRRCLLLHPACPLESPKPSKYKPYIFVNWANPI